MSYLLPELFQGLTGRQLLEAQVLGAILWNPDAIGAIDLTTEDFSMPLLSEAYAAMLTLKADGAPINEATVAKITGHAADVCALPWRVTPTGANVLYFLAELKKEIANQKKRDAAETLRASVADGNDAVDAAQAMNRQIEEIDSVYGDGRADEKMGFSNAVREIFRKIREREYGATTTETGLGWLDRITKGFLPGDYICLAARPSCGKTALALQILASMAANGHKSMFISLEMGKEALAARLLSLIALQDASVAIRNPSFLGDQSRNHFLACQYDLGEVAKRIWVVKSGIKGPESLATKVRQAAEDGCSIVVCDYIGLVPHRGNIQRNQKIDEISKAWKWALGENKIPGIMLSQLNRGTEKDKRMPVLSDLKDSGSIEEDSDYVLFLHRPVGDDNLPAPITKFVQAKGRNVGTGYTELVFNGEHQRFGEKE